MQRRTIVAVAIAAAGTSVCFGADYYFASNSTEWQPELSGWGNLWFAWPFSLLALLALRGMSIAASALAFAAASAITAVGYDVAWNSTSSTAALGVFAAPFYALAAILALVLVDAFVLRVRVGPRRS